MFKCADSIQKAAPWVKSSLIVGVLGLVGVSATAGTTLGEDLVKALKTRTKNSPNVVVLVNHEDAYKQWLKSLGELDTKEARLLAASKATPEVWLSVALKNRGAMVKEGNTLDRDYLKILAKEFLPRGFDKKVHLGVLKEKRPNEGEFESSFTAFGPNECVVGFVISEDGTGGAGQKLLRSQEFSGRELSSKVEDFTVQKALKTKGVDPKKGLSEEALRILDGQELLHEAGHCIYQEKLREGKGFAHPNLNAEENQMFGKVLVNLGNNAKKLLHEGFAEAYGVLQVLEKAKRKEITSKGAFESIAGMQRLRVFEKGEVDEVEKSKMKGTGPVLEKSKIYEYDIIEVSDRAVEKSKSGLMQEVEIVAAALSITSENFVDKLKDRDLRFAILEGLFNPTEGLEAVFTKRVSPWAGQMAIVASSADSSPLLLVKDQLINEIVKVDGEAFEKAKGLNFDQDVLISKAERFYFQYQKEVLGIFFDHLVQARKGLSSNKEVRALESSQNAENLNKLYGAYFSEKGGRLDPVLMDSRLNALRMGFLDSLSLDPQTLVGALEKVGLVSKFEAVRLRDWVDSGMGSGVEDYFKRVDSNIPSIRDEEDSKRLFESNNRLGDIPRVALGAGEAEDLVLNDSQKVSELGVSVQAQNVIKTRSFKA